MAVTHLDRPSLEYWHAFDYCAGQASQSKRPMTLLASSQFYARHFEDRLLESDLSIVDTTNWSQDTQSNVIPLVNWQPQAGVWIWAEPSRGSLHTIANHWRQIAANDSQLLIVTSGWLAKRLPEWQTAPYPTIAPTSTNDLRSALQPEGAHLVAVYGFHGPVSIVYGVAATLLSQRKQLAWSDRFIYAMRKAYTVQGWQAQFAPVQVRILSKTN